MRYPCPGCYRSFHSIEEMSYHATAEGHWAPPGRSTVECCCGARIEQRALPDDIQRAADATTIWVHASTGDTRCYENDPLCLADPAAY